MVTLTIPFYYFSAYFLGDKSLQVYNLDDFTEVSYSPIKFFKYGVNNIRFNKTGDLLVTSNTEGSSHVLKLDKTTCEVSFDLNLLKAHYFMLIFLIYLSC